jgi:hypothetical protein
MEIELLLAQLTDRRAGPLTGDRLTDALNRVRAAHEVAGQVGAAAAGYASRAAADAVWLGASLADLAETTGNTRQAARKRWPDLGRVYRARRWLEGHDADLVAVVDLVVAVGPELDQRNGADLRDPLDRLRAAIAVDGPPPARWWALSEAVDRDLRTVVAVATPFTEAARHAANAAAGTVAHWDAATAPPG